LTRPFASPSVRVAQLRDHLQAQGAKAPHIDRILRAWLNARPLDAGPRHQPAESFLPLAVRQALPALAGELDQLAEVVSEHPDGEGAARLLVKLSDQQLVESVLLPRQGLCVSTQIGCAVGCTFCMTGREGLIRQVSSVEMLAQFVLARRQRPIRRVVFMGMGEPSHNLDNVLETIELLGTAGGIGHKNLVFSTVGDHRVFERLPQGPVVPALALSLHSTRAELRAQLLPKAAAISPEELVDRAETYARRTGYPIQYQWTLLAGLNDSLDEMDGIVRLLHGKYAIMNLIPYNSTAALDFQRPALAHITTLARYLHSQGIRTTVRNSAGQDVEGGCGQLRARAENARRPGGAQSAKSLSPATATQLRPRRLAT